MQQCITTGLLNKLSGKVLVLRKYNVTASKGFMKILREGVLKNNLELNQILVMRC